LESILGVVVIADDTIANTQDHRAVTTDKGFKGRFVLLVDEGRQQFPIRPVRSILQQSGPAKMPNHRVHLSRRHSYPPWPVAPNLYRLLPNQSELYTLFSFTEPTKGLPAQDNDGRGRIADAKTLRALADAGMTTAAIKRGMTKVRTWADGEPVAITGSHGAMLIRLPCGLAEPSGQLCFDFGDDAPIVGIASMSAAEWFEVGCEHEEDGDLEEAIHAYRQSLLIGGPAADVCFNLANALFAVGHREAAIERWRVAIELDPEAAGTWNNLGVALDEAENTAAAEHALQKAINLGFHGAAFNLSRMRRRIAPGT
jgi:tetratricopeptide (TPR) repeat protein